MQKKYLIRAAMILLLIAGSYFVLWASTKSNREKNTCTESMEDCCKTKPDQNSATDVIWEMLSSQFISISATAN